MAVYDLEEQEKIDSIKAWWKAQGTLILVLIAAVVVGIAGVQAWNYYQKQKTEQAAELYDNVLKAQGSGDAKKIRDASRFLMEGCPSSGYASRAAPISAQASFDTGISVGGGAACNGP
jgi:predicted negative regulator of RcsB-dependent stress response